MKAEKIETKVTLVNLELSENEAILLKHILGCRGPAKVDCTYKEAVAAFTPTLLACLNRLDLKETNDWSKYGA